MRRARWINAVAGAWLFVSAWLLPGAATVRINETVVGLLAFVVAILAMGVQGARRANTVLGLWAISSPFVFAFPASPAALNQVATGLVIFTASLWPAHSDLRRGHPASR